MYKITNLVNGKIYIGCRRTLRQPEEDSYLGSGTRLRYAKLKYGLAAFQKEILSTHVNADEMLAEEARLVTREFLQRKDVYNLVLGGHVINIEALGKSMAGNQNGSGVTRSEEYKRNISAKMKGNQHAAGAVRSEEWKSKQSIAKRGRIFSEESRQKMAAAKRGKPGVAWLKRNAEKI